MISEHQEKRRTSLRLKQQKRIKARLKVNTQAKEKVKGRKKIASKEEEEEVVDSLFVSLTSRSSSRSKCQKCQLDAIFAGYQLLL